MAEQSISVTRDRDRVMIEDRQRDPDYTGVLKRTWMLPADAIEFGEAVAAIGRAILKEQLDV